MNIKTKFNVGDQVFIIKQKDDISHTDCKICGGTGKVHIRETCGELDCPSCNGKCFDIQSYTEYYKAEAVVNKILTKTNENGIIICRIKIFIYIKKYLKISKLFKNK